MGRWHAIGPWPPKARQRQHAKLVIDRDREALLLGSPLEQDYYDSLRHAIYDPRRGKESKKGPIHDVSVGVRGPAVGHLQELFNNHWNLAAPDDKLPVTPALPPAVSQADADEFLTTAQVVRTLDSMFTEGETPPNPNGEQGVLEAYLRAIHFAERFVYIENQYFNNDIITQALIDALAARPKLVVILFLNSAPDMRAAVRLRARRCGARERRGFASPVQRRRRVWYRSASGSCRWTAARRRPSMRAPKAGASTAQRWAGLIAVLRTGRWSLRTSSPADSRARRSSWPTPLPT